MSPSRGFALLPYVRRSVQMLLVALVASAVLLTGFAGPAAAHPKQNVAVSSYPALKYGSKGAAVKWLQTALRVSPRSGYFGVKTKAAVVQFQKRNGLRRTGIVGPAIWWRLGVKHTRTEARASRSAGRLVPGTAAFGQRVMALASVHKGKRWVRGGNGPQTFDCSGLIKYVYRQLGYGSLPRTSAGMRAVLPRLAKSKVRVGDLVFVHNGGGGRVGHVGIYAGNGYWFESSSPRRPIGKNKAWSSAVSYGRVR